jgi:hypothetical protein
MLLASARVLAVWLAALVMLAVSRPVRRSEF